MDFLKFAYLLLLALILLIQGCASKNLQYNNVRFHTGQYDKYTQFINKQYPDSFALTQRIILNAGGKQYDFIGQLAMHRGKAFRAAAFGEMGGLFIDILFKNDSLSVLANPTNMPENPISKGVAEDIRQIFCYNIYSEPEVAEADTNIVNIIFKAENNERLIYSINKKTNQILKLETYSRDKQIRSVKFMEFKKYPELEWKIPSIIKLTNNRWHYSLEIYLLKFNTLYDANKVFKIN
ncbi:MAG: hypothetical protein P8X42_18630 [Calditrichaceae bacterium]|jgi:hypothetical protein